MWRLISLFTLLILLLCLLSFDGKLTYNDKFAADQSRWHYVPQVDKATGLDTKVAQVMSLNEVVLTNTDDKRARVLLVVSNKGRLVTANRVSFFLMRGNYGECSGYEEGACFVYVTFDDEPSVTMSAWVAAGKPNNALLLRDADYFIDRLKIAKRVSVVLKFHENEAKVLTFNVEGFKWVLFDDLGI